jgi:ABC-type uncharacterized transport system involved in gliding motility auxiliary subunit
MSGRVGNFSIPAATKACCRALFSTAARQITFEGFMGFAKHKEAYFRFAVYLVALILVNWAGTTLFFRIDLTRDKMFSLSTASRQAVSTLTEPLTINVFFTANLPAPHNGTEQYLRDLLDAYGVYANRFFNVHFYSMGADSDSVEAKGSQATRLAADYGIEPIQIQVIDKDEVRFQKAYMAMVLIHGDLIERVAPITTIDGLEYRLTSAIGRLNNKVSALLALRQPIQVKLFFSENLQPIAPYMGLKQLPELPRRLAAVVEAVSAKNHGKLVFERIDPQPAQIQSNAYGRYHLLNLQWPEMDGGKVPAGIGAIGLAMEHGDKFVTIPLLQVINIPLLQNQYALVPFDQLEKLIDDHVATLININEDIGILAGKGTFDFAGQAMMDPTGRRQQDPIDNLRRLLEQNYSLKDVDLDSGIASSLRCLVIARPTEAFSDYELFQIDQFLMQGKSVALFIDPFQQSPSPGPVRGASLFQPVDTGLEKLLVHYGIQLKQTYVMDENCYKQRLPEQMGGGERPLYFAPVLKGDQISRQPEFMRSIKGLVALRNAPLVADRQRLSAGGMRLHELLSSSDKSWEQGQPINLNPALLTPPGEQRQRFALAFLAEGSFSSYFAGKPLPAKPVVEKSTPAGPGTDPQAPANPNKKDPQVTSARPAATIETQGAMTAKGQPGKIFVLGSTEMLTDAVVDEEGRSPNALFLLNSLDYLNDREEMAVLRGKKQRFMPLTPTSPFARMAVKTANIIGVPVLVAIGGLIVWAFRRNRQRRIQAIFNP